MLMKNLLAASLMVVGGVAQADSGEQAVRDALHALLPNVKVDQVAKSELPGFFEAFVGGQVIYVSSDGKYLLQGNLFNVPERKDLTSARIAAARVESLHGLPMEKRLNFPAANPKHTVTVFTDVDCPYCRQFHKQIAAMNQLGISVNYVLFPLDIHPGADKKAVAVWCSSDRNGAYTAAMNGQDPGTKTCDNPIAETKAFSLAIGIDSTPTMLAEDGTHVSGNIAANPQQLLVELDRIAAAKSNKGAVAASQ